MGDARALGRAALTIGGGVLFGPWGALVGGALGSLLLPPEGPKGPRLNELNIQHSTVGAPIPIVYGTAALAGNVIWSGGLLEAEHEGQSAGKGGPSGPTTYTYSVDVAVGICEGPIDGVRRIWADADLIYDASDDSTLADRFGGLDDLSDMVRLVAAIRAGSAQLDFQLYTGTEDQLADPTIESYEGVGQVPGFRGLAYIVFNNFQVEKFGNRIPNFRMEVFTGAETPCGQYQGGQLLPWNDGQGLDPRFDEGAYQYSADGSTWYDSVAQAGADLSLTAFGGVRTGYDLTTPHGFSAFSAANAPHSDCYPVDLGDKLNIHWYFNSITAGLQTNCSIIAASGGLPLRDEIVSTYGVDNVFRWSGEYNGGGSYLEGNGYWVMDTGGNEAAHFSGNSQPGSFDYSPTGILQFLLDVPMLVRRVVQPPDACSGGVCVEWVPTTGTFKALQAYDTDGTYVLTSPVNPVLSSTDPNYSNQAYWEAAYAAALAAGEPIAAGLTYGVDYPNVITSAYLADCTTVETDCVPMSVIVADICRRCGLRTDTSSQIDVSGLTTCVTGYIVGRQMSGRDALGPLRMFGLWDSVESGDVLRFVERGAPVVASLDADQLGAHENGSEAPSAVIVARVQEKELPRRVRLHFAQFLHDHEPSEQSASRITTEAIDELDLELAISMEPDTAAQLADIHLYTAWVSRNTYTFSLDHDWLHLEPTDCVELPVDGQTERVRIVSVDFSIGGILRVEAVRDDDGAYVSTAVGRPSEPSGGVPGGPGSGLICPTGMVVLDLPRLREVDIDAGYYVALYGLCSSWACAEVYRSSDGGLTYGRVARTDLETTVGEILAISGPATDPTLPGDSPAYDDANSITVTLFEGELASITDAQIAAGQNTAAIGVDGRWVIIQFKTATLDTGDQWTLTDLIWGVNDTAHLLGTTVEGDTFVLLSDSGLLRVPESPEAIGVEKQLKAVTCGQAIDDADAVDFTTWGLSYRRTCPSTVLSASVTEPPVSPADGDAYLLPNDTSLAGVWADHGGQIAHWSDETESWVYCTPVPGTIIHVEDGGDTSGDGGGDVISGGDGTYTPAPWASVNATYLTEADESERLPNSLRLLPGDNVHFEQDTSGGTLTVNATGNIEATYLTAEDETADLPNSLRLIAGSNIALDVDTSGNTLEISSTAGGGGGSLSLVAESTVAGSAATSISISGLDLAADEKYVIHFTADNATASAASISLYFNADTTATNYDRQAVTIASNLVTASRANDALIGTLNANAVNVNYTITPLALDLEGRPRSTWDRHGDNTTALAAQLFWHMRRTVANVTQIQVTSSVANSLAIGSKLTIWKLTS